MARPAARKARDQAGSEPLPIRLAYFPVQSYLIQAALVGLGGFSVLDLDSNLACVAPGWIVVTNPRGVLPPVLGTANWMVHSSLPRRFHKV